MPTSQKIESYYEAVAPYMVPFLAGRKVAVELQYNWDSKPTYRRHEGKGEERRWIEIDSVEQIVAWVRRKAIAFHAHLEANDGSVTFFLDIDSRNRSTEMARIGAIHALDLIHDAGLDALVKYSGSDGYHLMWAFPADKIDEIGDVWAFQRDLVEALADQVELRLELDPRAEPIRAAVGAGESLVTTSSADRSNRQALLFDKLILKSNANGRIPYSLHATTLRSSVPLTQEELLHFRWQQSFPGPVAKRAHRVDLPVVTVAQAADALDRWRR
jgi:hypothetical protein